MIEPLWLGTADAKAFYDGGLARAVPTGDQGVTSRCRSQARHSTGWQMGGSRYFDVGVSGWQAALVK